MNDIYPVAVPKWGIEMLEGTLTRWNRREGDSVARGDAVFEMESDKIVNVWESPVDGVLRRVLAGEGDTLPVGALLAVIAPADRDDAAIEQFIAQHTAADPADQGPAAAPHREPDQAAPQAAAGGRDAATRSSPAVRALARELGVDLNTVTGSGRRGRITEDDVRAAVAGQGDTAPATPAAVTPLSPTRRSIARRVTQAKQEIPHYYLTAEFELDGLLAHRESLAAQHGRKVSINDLLVWCTGQALMREPRVNIHFIDGEIHQFHDANIAVAVASDDGLYPATVRGAQAMTVAELADALAALTERARRGALSHEDVEGGSFTVSNLGMYGVHNFTVIINPPMGAILALGRAQQRAVVRAGELAVATLISATLSCDHRVIDGAVGAAFLQALGEEIAALQ